MRSPQRPSHSSPHRLGIAIAASTLFVVLTGCKSDVRVTESTNAVDGVLAARSANNAAIADIDRAITAMNEIQAEGDMQGSFKKFVVALNAIQASDDRAQERLEAMNARRDAYIARWEAEAATVQNPKVHAGMEERRNRVAARFKGLADTAQSVHEDYQPFIKDLQEIQRALSLDLTAAGVTALAPAINDAKLSGVKLKAKLSNYEDELNDMIDKLSVPPVTAPSTAATQ